MERFIRLNRSILDCDLAKGGWRLDEEGIAAIEDEVAELVRIIAQSHRGVDPARRGGFPRHHPARAPPLQDPSAGLPLARMGGPDPARPMEEPARGRRLSRSRPPLRRPLPRGPDGDAIGRC